MDQSFHMDIEMKKLGKDVLVTAGNQEYHVVLEQYQHSIGIKINNHK